MSVNQNRPHVLVLPEDDANRQLAKGFQLQVPPNRQRQMQVLPVAGGWTGVLKLFQSVHIGEMERNSHRFMVLLIDFDGRRDRLGDARARIPNHLSDRVFILGAWTKPEDLKKALGPYETIGLGMAVDCREETNTTWGHPLFQHNASELDRLRRQVRPILFPSNE